MPETFIVENSISPRAIGDTIASFPALHAYAWKTENPIDVYLSCAVARPLLSHHKINKLEERPDKAKILDVQQIAAKHSRDGWSMSQGYMEAIGLGDIAAVKSPELTIDIGEQPDIIAAPPILLAPFSHSDGGTNTKVWPENRWETLIIALKQKSKFIGLLGTSRDIEDSDFWRSQPLTHILDKSLQEVAWNIKFADLVISVDNGINWITQGVKTGHLLLLPQTAHPGWTANRNPNAFNVAINVEAEKVLELVWQGLGMKK